MNIQLAIKVVNVSKIENSKLVGTYVDLVENVNLVKNLESEVNDGFEVHADNEVNCKLMVILMR